MAQRHVMPDRAAIVVVGDAAEIREQVQPYSQVIELYDTDGNQKEEGSRQKAVSRRQKAEELRFL